MLRDHVRNMSGDRYLDDCECRVVEAHAGATHRPSSCSATPLLSTLPCSPPPRHPAQATLAFTWDVEDYEENELPRPEFIKAFHSGIWRQRDGGGGAMRKECGFYATGQKFISLATDESKEEENINPRLKKTSQGTDEVLVMNFWSRMKVYSVGIPLLLMMTIVMLIITFAILTFRLLLTVGASADYEEYSSSASAIGGLLNTVWITIMNIVYSQVAHYLNELENHRTETEHEDSLIVKTFLVAHRPPRPRIYLASARVR